MTRDEFLAEIRRETGFMLPKDRNIIISYFIERLSSVSDEDVTVALGTPKGAIRGYFADNANGLSPAMRALMIAAGVVAAPVVINVLLVAAAFVIALTAIAAVIIAGLPFAAAAMWLGGIGRFIGAFFSGAAVGDVLCGGGVGLLISGIGIFLLILVIKLYGRFIPWLLRSVYGVGVKLISWFRSEIWRLI